MRPIAAIALFCEDIRDEKAGTDSLVGIMPDNIAIGELGKGGFLPKLGVYIRIQIDHDTEAKEIKSRISFPGGRSHEIGRFSNEVIESSKSAAKSNGIPYTGLINKAVFVPAPIQATGKIEIIIDVDGQEFTCGVLNIMEAAVSSAS